MKQLSPALSARCRGSLVVLHDLAMVGLSSWIALRWLRAPAGAPPAPSLALELAIVLVAQGLVLAWSACTAGLWRFASLPDLLNMFAAALLGVLLVVVGLFLLRPAGPRPARGAAAVSVRVDGPARHAAADLPAAGRTTAGCSHADDAKRVLVLGAGRAGETLVRDLRRDGRYQPVGFLDDSRPARRQRAGRAGARARSRTCRGSRARPRADCCVIAMPSASAAEMRGWSASARRPALPFRTVPRLADVLEGRSLPGELKEVAIEDLLGRKPVQLGLEGDPRLARAARAGDRRWRLDRLGTVPPVRAPAAHRTLVHARTSRTAAARDQRELRARFPGSGLRSGAGRLRRPGRLPHRAGAAARGGVPRRGLQAGAAAAGPAARGRSQQRAGHRRTVARACREAGVATFVLISTDKAVDPVNVLGATKRFAEMVCQGLVDRARTRFVDRALRQRARFGRQRGAAVPRADPPRRSGHRDRIRTSRRYFMTIPEACQLILQARRSGAQPAVYTLDMGEPVAHPRCSPSR